MSATSCRSYRRNSRSHDVYAGALSTAPLNRHRVPHALRDDAIVALHSALELHGVANQVFQTVYYFSRGARKDVVFDRVTTASLLLAPSLRLRIVSFRPNSAPTTFWSPGAAAALAAMPPSQFLILETEELFDGKIKALIDRRHPRDLYDLFRFTKTHLNIIRRFSVNSRYFSQARWTAIFVPIRWTASMPSIQKTSNAFFILY